jgi:pilus assembly protein CpaE
MGLPELLFLGLLGGLILLLVLAVVAWYSLRASGESEAGAQKPVPSMANEITSANGEPSTGRAAPPSESPVSKVAPSPRADDNSSDHKPEAGEKIRILIVDDNPDTREHVSRLLYFEDDLEVIGQAINGAQGIDMAMELRPHIVLMDINMPDMDGITATGEMTSKAPYSQVVMMSVQAEQHYMKQAMAAGARDFQPKPFTSDELINCIRKVYQIGQPTYERLEAFEQTKALATGQTHAGSGEGNSDTPVIAVYSPKGGSGTSTLAVNLAVALQREYGGAILMDADFQFGDILVHLNTPPTRTISDLIHNDELDIELLPDILLPHSSGLKLLLAPPQPEYADAITPEIVGEVIDRLKQDFKAVIVDTNAKLSAETLAVLDKADYILIVTMPELPAVKSAKLFLELADSLEYSPDRMGVLINRANMPGGVSPKQIGKVLKLQHAYFVPHDPRMHQAINRGISVTQQDVGAPSAQAIADVAKKIWQKLTATQEEAQPIKEMA